MIHQINAMLSKLNQEFSSLIIERDEFPSGVIIVDIEFNAPVWIEIEYSPREQRFGISLNDSNTLPFTAHDSVVSSIEDAYQMIHALLEQHIPEPKIAVDHSNTHN